MKAQVNTKHKDKGMTNPKSNVIIVKSMDIIPMNVERNKMTLIIGKMKILQKKIITRVMFF